MPKLTQEKDPRAPLHLWRRTRIVATLGPAVDSDEALRELVKAGVDVVRLNLSHGTIEGHLKRVAQVRALEVELGRSIGIMADLCGPKIRIGSFTEEPVQLTPDQMFTITTRQVPGDSTIVSCIYPNLHHDVAVGQTIYLSDGLIQLQVESIEGQDIHCHVLTSGVLTSGKGLNLPTTQLSTPSITEKDRRDLEGIAGAGVDFVALSFVRSPDDILALKEILNAQGSNALVVAKIEKPEAVSRLSEILEVTDVVMVARGDLGVETSVEAMPVIQKQMLQQSRAFGIPAITATQMLESMISNPRPTRAEASDVANAVLDGSDAVMLSGETASGKYPHLAVQTMARIIEVTETQLSQRLDDAPIRDIEGMIGWSTSNITKRLGIRAICVYTRTGTTARIVSKFRPLVPILAFTPSREVMRQLMVTWGVYPVHFPHPEDGFEDLHTLRSYLVEPGFLRDEDLVCIVSGRPRGTQVRINALRILRLNQDQET